MQGRIRTGVILAVFGGLAVVTRGFTVLPRTYYMTGPSMVPGVGQGAWFVARPATGRPARGQLVLWEHSLDDSLFHVLRRAVGLEGDTLRMRAGTLLVNGAPAPWPWRVVEPRAERPLEGAIVGTIYNWGPVIVGADSVFLLSDTRDMFGWPDSRFVGAVPRERIVARYLFSLRAGDK